jgi:hypothetical protein
MKKTDFTAEQFDTNVGCIGETAWIAAMKAATGGHICDEKVIQCDN